MTMLYCTQSAPRITSHLHGAGKPRSITADSGSSRLHDTSKSPIHNSNTNSPKTFKRPTPPSSPPPVPVNPPPRKPNSSVSSFNSSFNRSTGKSNFTIPENAEVGEYDDLLSPSIPTSPPPPPPNVPAPMKIPTSSPEPPQIKRSSKPTRFRMSVPSPPQHIPDNDDLYTAAEDVPHIAVQKPSSIDPTTDEPIYDPVYEDIPTDKLVPPAPKPISRFSNNQRSKFIESEPLYQVYRSRTLSHASSKASKPFIKRTSIPDLNNSDRRKSSDKDSWKSELMAEDTGTSTMWRNVPEVEKSGIPATLNPDQIKLQQSQFEVITSQASYLRSLQILQDHFMNDWAMQSTDILPRKDRKDLFSNIEAVIDIEYKLLQDLEENFWANLKLTDVCELISKYAEGDFSVYVRYIQNQVYQDRVLTRLQRTHEKFAAELCRLESSPACNKLPLLSFLMLPMQRVTRLPLLITAIVGKADTAKDTEMYKQAKASLGVVNRLVKECNEGARKMQQTEQLAEIASMIDYAPKVKTFALVSQSRALIKKGEMMVVMDTKKRAQKQKLLLLLFTDVLLIARKKGFSETRYEVIDWAKRAMLYVNERAVSENTIFLVLLENSAGKRVEMSIMPSLTNEISRWTDALNPQKGGGMDESIYESWDSPQYTCIKPYTARQPDELSIDVDEVMKVVKKTSDGWLEGEKLRDGECGWFPAENCEEICDEHVRARNLRNLYTAPPMSPS